MAACPACDAALADGVRACPACGTSATFSFDTAKGGRAGATRATSAARKEVGLLRATGVEPLVAEKLIDRADEEFRQERPARAFAYAQAARRAANISKERARLQEDLGKAEEEVRAAKQAGADTVAAEKALQEASQRLADGKVRSVRTWLRKASVRVAEGQRVKAAESLLSSARKAIRYSKERGADVAAAEEELSRAEDALRAKAFDAAKDAAGRAREAAEQSRKYSRYEKFVAGAERSIEQAKKSGADLAEPRRLLGEARRALKAGLFADAQSFARQTRDAVAEAKRYRTAELLIGRAEKAARREERRGVDVTGPALALGQAHEALEAREYRRVREVVREAREGIREAVVARRLQQTLNTLTTDLEELRRIGAKPEEAQALLGEASAALESRDFDKCRRLSEQCRRASDDAREARRQELVIDTIQRIVEAAAGAGRVDPAQVRGLIQDVEAMLASGEAVDVESLVRARFTTIDAEKLRDVTRRLADLRSMLLELRRADIDVSGSEDAIFRANEAIDTGHFEEAERQIAELEEVANSLLGTLRDSALETVEKARAASAKARKAGIPIPDAIRMLKSAEAALEAGKVYEALEFGRIAQARAESAWKSHFETEAKRDVEAMRTVADRVRRARERIDLLVSHIEYLTGVGVDVTPARDALGSAQRALMEKRIDEVEAHLMATEQIVEGFRGALRKSAEEALERLRKVVHEARAQGLMSPEMEAVFSRAEQAVREDHYREAIETIEALEETIEHAKEERVAIERRKDLDRAKRASDRFIRVKRMVEELRRANIDIHGSDEALLEAEKALQARDYDRVDALLGDLEETAREMRAELVAATRFLVGKARETVEAAERLGLDVTDARRLLENAEAFLEKGKLDDAVESANTAKQRAEALQRLRSEEEARAERTRVETARQKIDRLKATLDDLRRADITVDGSEDAMSLAEVALEEKRYEDVHLALSETENLAETLETGLRAAAEQLLARSRENVEAARKEGLNVRRADMVLLNAADSIREGRYVEAIEYHKVIDDIVDDARRMRKFRELEAEVDVLRTELARAAALGGDVLASQTLLDRAKEEVSLGRYDRVEEYTQQVRHGLEVTRAQILEGKLDRARVAIGKAQMLGADTADADALFAEAEKAAKSGSYEALDVLVRRIEEKTATASASSLAAKAEEDFLALEALEKQVREAGMEVPEAQEFIAEARRLKDEQRFDSMMEVVARARALLEEGSRERVAAQYKEKMRGLASMIEAAKRIGANVAEAERILAQAGEAVEKNDMNLADILVKQAEVSTGLQIQSFIQNKYPNLLVRLPTSGLQANAWNKYVVEVSNKGTLGAKNVELTFEGDVDVRGVEPIPELGIDETKALEIGVRPKKEGDVPVNVRVFYERYFDENKYEISDAKELRVESAGTYLVEDVFLIHGDGRLIAHESRKFRQEIDEDIFSGMLTVVQDFIRDSFRARTETGIKRLDFGQSKILIERSSNCFLTSVVLGSEPALLPLYMAEVLREIEERYGQTLASWSGMLHELPGIEEVIKKLVLVSESWGAEQGDLGDTEVAEMERMLRAAKDVGAETEEVEGLLAEAKSSLETDMDLAWQLLSRAKVQAQETQEKHHDRMRLLVDQTSEAVERLRALDIDAGPAEILLKEAREAYQEGRFDKVQEIADNVRSTLERAQQESMARKIESDLSGLIQEIEKVRGEGVDVTRAEAFLVKIEDALQKRNYRAVGEFMEKARDALREQRKSAILRRSKEEMSKLTAMLVEAKEIGAESKEAEALLLRAREALEDGRVDDLDALVRQAETVAKQRIQRHLEDRYPRLFLTMPTEGLQANAWNRFILEIANKGNLAAKDVNVALTGNLDVRGLRPIPRIDPNERQQLELGVKPKAAGPQPVDVEVRYFRPLDDRPLEVTDTKEMRIEGAGTYTVEDVFLIHRDGRLIVHESRKFRDDVDEDIFSGMLTVVLNYVKEAMQSRSEGGLRRVDFGKDKVLFERGPNVFLATAVVGDEPVSLPIFMVDTLQDIEDRYGDRLAKWTGFLTELEGIHDLVRRLLYVTAAPDANLGPLEGSPIAEALKVVAEASPEEAGADFVQEARQVIEAKDFSEASTFVRTAVRSYMASREELREQLREAVIAHGAAAGLDVTDEQMKAYIDVVRRVVEAVFAAREKAGLDPVWPVKRVAIKVDAEQALDAVTSFRKIIVNQTLAKELDIVRPEDTWRGLNLALQLDSEAISRAYRLWARKIEILLRSQDAWKIKHGLDKGEYNLGVEGQKVRIDPSMVWFTETVPDHVIEEKFDGGVVYVDTELTEDILAEGYARELVNIIRDARLDLKLSGDAWIETRVKGSETLNKLLKNWRDFISRETNSHAVRFVRGEITEGYVVECSLGAESFTVSVKPVEGASAAG